MRTPTLRTLTLPVATTLAALLASCGTEAEPTAENAPVLAAAGHVAQHSTSTIPEDNFGINPCNGETVHFVGTIFQQTNVVSVDDATLHIEVAERLTATGIGLTTGVSYRVHAEDGVSFNSPTATATQATFTERDHNLFHSDVPGLSFKGAFFIHAVALPSGEVKITREVDTEEDGVCLG
jgi:hypothetical protein